MCEAWLHKRVLRGSDRCPSNQFSRPRLPFSMAVLRQLVDACHRSTCSLPQQGTVSSCHVGRILQFPEVYQVHYHPATRWRLVPGRLGITFLVSLEDRPLREGRDAYDRSSFTTILCSNHAASLPHRNSLQCRPWQAALCIVQRTATITACIRRYCAHATDGIWLQQFFVCQAFL